MLKPDEIVINTSPLIALVAALGDLSLLESLYTSVWVPFEVCQEILTGDSTRFAAAEFQAAEKLNKQTTPLEIPLEISSFLLNSLDLGEASVIQLALNENITTVCVDEAVGRRYARLSGLSVTGSIGVLIRAKREGYPISIETAIKQMLRRGIRLSTTVINTALKQAEEDV